MATKISWCEETWNPATSCSKVSSGCRFCYAERVARNIHGQSGLAADVMAPTGYTGLPWTKQNAALNVRIHPGRLLKPLTWRQPRVIFVCSMSDLFHENIPDSFIAAVWGVMAATPQHTYIVLTKRPQRMLRWLCDVQPPSMGPGVDHVDHRILSLISETAAYTRRNEAEHERAYDAMAKHVVSKAWPLPNVWVGTSIENQDAANDRMKYICMCPAAVRFLSVEPLLESVNLEPWLPEGQANYQCSFCHRFTSQYHGRCPWCGEIGGLCGSHMANRSYVEDGWARWRNTQAIDWVIVGGESGPQYRYMDHAWARQIRDVCVRAGVSFFFKQSAGFRSEEGTALEEEDGSKWEWRQTPKEPLRPPLPVSAPWRPC